MIENQVVGFVELDRDERSVDGNPPVHLAELDRLRPRQRLGLGTESPELIAVAIDTFRRKGRHIRALQRRLDVMTGRGFGVQAGELMAGPRPGAGRRRALNRAHGVGIFLAVHGERTQSVTGRSR